MKPFINLAGSKSSPQPLVLNLAERHAAIRRAFTPLPGRQPRDNYKPVNISAACDGQTMIEALCGAVKHLPVAYWETECARGLILNLKHEPVAATQIVRAGERYRHLFPNVTEPDVNGAVEILYEDEALIVVNKPAPLPMHAGGRFYRNTLQHILNEAYHPQKPHPSHRLDANTTGVVLVTRARQFAGRLQMQFARRQVEKVYLVRVQGQPEEDVFSCRVPISARSGESGSRTVDLKNGLEARTEFRVRQRYNDGTTLMEAHPLTGRTHQIRVHLWHLGLSVCGDTVYLPDRRTGATQTWRADALPLCLHASTIKFIHPLSQLLEEFTAPPPAWAVSGGVTENWQGCK